MENVILIVHLILALCLIGVVLLQRSEGGGLGLGGGGGGGLVSSRSAATALGKVTWGFAIAFICTSITLTIIAAQNTAADLLSVGAGHQAELYGAVLAVLLQYSRRFVDGGATVGAAIIRAGILAADAALHPSQEVISPRGPV